MAFCKNCGTKLGENERFCGNCGTPLECTMSNPQVPNIIYAAKNPQPMINVNFDNYKVYMSEAFNLTINMITKPISTILSVSKSLKKQTSFLLFALLSIVFGLLNIWNVKAITAKAVSASNGISVNEIQGFLTSFIENITFSIPYGKIFLFSLILFIASTTIISLEFHLIKKYIIKKSSTPQNVFVVAVCSSVPYIFGFLVQIVLSYISPTIGFIAIFIGVIISVLCLFRGMSSELELQEDKMAFLIPISYLVMFLIYYIILRIIMKG